jgi:putative FmdB family regulatory protein
LPIYEYRCKNGHTFEVMQSMTDDPITKCEVCGAAVERVFHPVAVHFKGSGFYTTDYGRNRSGAGAAADSSDSGDSGKSESKSEKKSEASESSGTKSESSSTSGSGSSDS